MAKKRSSKQSNSINFVTVPTFVGVVVKEEDGIKEELVHDYHESPRESPVRETPVHESSSEDSTDLSTVRCKQLKIDIERLAEEIEKQRQKYDDLIAEEQRLTDIATKMEEKYGFPPGSI